MTISQHPRCAGAGHLKRFRNWSTVGTQRERGMGMCKQPSLQGAQPISVQWANNTAVPGARAKKEEIFCLALATRRKFPEACDCDLPARGLFVARCSRVGSATRAIGGWTLDAQTQAHADAHAHAAAHAHAPGERAVWRWNSKRAHTPRQSVNSPQSTGPGTHGRAADRTWTSW